MHALSIGVPVCVYLWAIVEQYDPVAGSALHYLVAQTLLIGNLNKGKQKNKNTKAEVVFWAMWNGEISQLRNKRKREVV